ncbi:beta-lactamase family protein [Solirubrobacter phytolaccae]|uniref:Beta-lactamase family protein n=1 Tax=Solirubrobacter phytolaccae TaxID=1404360 RepID=A0A9X3S810_9ACTN|nr:serine hydrolase domain-containing protein [Solirubrobacter phytolaccae]MDA0179781.1 beta-lactamase family protein [Solirubrobacter phytolaccae]
MRDVLEGLVADGSLPGAAVAVIRGGDREVVTVGFADLARSVPLGPDTRFRLASLSKPIVSALALGLIEDGGLGLEDPIGRWLPELAAPTVLRGDAVVPAAGPVRVRHLLDATCGWGFPGELTAGFERMLAAVGDGRHRHRMPVPDVWVAALARTPLLFEPGEQWLYDTSYDLLGVVLARAAGQPLPEALHARLLEPLGMRGTGFAASGALVEEVRAQGGELVPAGYDEDVRRLPRFPSGAGGLFGTVEDLSRFAHMLVNGGDGVLAAASVEAMTSDQLAPAQRRAGGAYLAGQSWGYGGSVDVEPTEPWHAPGRYGWIGVTGTSLHVRREEGTAIVVLTARELHDAADMALMGTLWTAAIR